MKKHPLDLFIPMLTGLFILACSSVSSESGGNSPAGGSGSNSGVDTISYQLPTSPGVPPEDTIQQIGFTGGGGNNGPECNMYCTDMIDQKIIVLSRFQPNQRLTIDVYSPYGNDDVWEFSTEFSIQVDDSGSLMIHLDGRSEYIVRDEDRNIIAIPKGVYEIP